MQGRNQLSPDGRPLKRHYRRGESRQSGGGTDKTGQALNAIFPDVYPQQEKQEEDNLNPDRVARGYQIELIHNSLNKYEYVSHAHESHNKLDKLLSQPDDPLYKTTARCIKYILQKKGELNIIMLDKNWIKENNIRGLISDGFREFFDSLVSGRRLQLKDHKRISLAACFPRFPRGSYDKLTSLSVHHKNSIPLCEAMDLLYEKGVPIQKAIWFFKMNQIAHPIFSTSKQKKTSAPCEDYASDQRHFFIRYMRCMLKEFDKVQAIPGQLEQNPYYQRWGYFSCLIKHSFEDGMLDRHEFVGDMCDLLSEFANFPLEQPQTFRLLLTLMTQFTDILVQNVFLARRLANTLCHRLAQYKRDFEKMKSPNTLHPPPIPAEVCFDELANCQHHRPSVLIMFGFLHAIIIDCPSAMVWTPFEPSELLEGSYSKLKPSEKASRASERENALQSVAWLCGSPLDHLPCPIEVTSQHLAQSAREETNKLLTERVAEIRQRSQFVEDRWAFINPSNAHAGLEFTVEMCLDVLAFLDTTPLDEPNALALLFKRIFQQQDDADGGSVVKTGIEIRVHVLVQWAVSAQREGTHRALVVANLLKRLIGANKALSNNNNKTMQQMLIECLEKDWLYTNKMDKSNATWKTEFANLMLLFYELQRFGLFNHDQYVRALMRHGAFSQESLFKRLNSLKETKKGGNNNSADNDPRSVPCHPSSTEPAPVKQEQQMIISFIPTTPTIPPPTISANNNKGPEEFARLLPEHSADEHIHLEDPELGFHERFLLHLPVEQLEANRDACNQRAIMLYGITEQRENAKHELRKLASQICKIWKRMNVEICAQQGKSSVFWEVRFRKRCNAEQMGEVMSKFRAQTYYDQLVICGWCAENLVDTVDEFLGQIQELTSVNKGGQGGQDQQQQQQMLLLLPGAECLDMLCEMMETCQSIHSLVTLAEELIPFLVQIEHVLQIGLMPTVDCVQGSLTSQLAYVLCARLADHFFYFLHSAQALAILNSLHQLVQPALLQFKCGELLPTTGCIKAVGMFLLHARDKLLGAELHLTADGKLIAPVVGRFDELEPLFPPSGAGTLAKELRYDQNLMADLLNRPSLYEFRFFPLLEFRSRLQTIRDEHSRYSFVINALKAANACGQDYERLVELANFCANISVNLGITTEWCTAVQELCYSSVSNNNWKELIMEINVDDFSTHYPLSTFVLLLISKYCISAHGLICRLLANVFYPQMKQEGSFDGYDNGLCLALYICASIVCGTDIPFTFHDINVRPSSNRDFNQLALRMVHIDELATSIFPLLSVIIQLVDELKRKVEARKEAVNFRTSLSQQLAVARCSLLSICEQNWVIQQMFSLCDTNAEMEMFTNCPRLTNHSIGQQLLRIALRRKSERHIKQELMECTDKKIYEKLLSALSIWNMRATYYDFKLTILETFPESQMAKLSNGNQQLANYYQMAMYLFNNIATACHQLFLSLLRDKDNDHQRSEELMNVKNFRPSAINCYWLIAPLAEAMPSPPSPPTGNPQNALWCSWISSALKASFLKVVSDNLSAGTGGGNFGATVDASTGQQQQYEQLLAYQPFLNLVLTCTEGEDVKQLVDSLLGYFEGIIGRVRKNLVVPHQSSFLPEREGLILRLNLVTGLFDTLIANNNSEAWASTLFQLLFFEVLTWERDADYFDTCLDVLMLLCHKMFSHRAYNSFVGKFKNLRIPDDLHCLQQLLPVPKSQAELTAWDSFSNSIPHSKLVGNPPVTGGSTGKTNSGSSTANAQQIIQQLQPNLPTAKPQIQGLIIDKQTGSVHKQILRMLRHEHWFQKFSNTEGQLIVAFIPRPGLPGEKPLWPDPFLSSPEMEQQAIIMPLDELQQQEQQQMGQVQVQQQQRMQHQLQTTQQQLPLEQQQQQPPQQQQFKMEPAAQFKMEPPTTAASEQQQQQQMQQMRVYQQQMQQQQAIAAAVAHQQQHQQQFVLQQQQQQSMMGGGGGGAMAGAFMGQQPMINMLQQQGAKTAANRSGSSTPAATESPRTGPGRGGGRRKSANTGAGGSQPGTAGNAATATGGGTTKGQKRKKETASGKQQTVVQQQPQQMMGIPPPMENMFPGGGPAGGMQMPPQPQPQQQQQQQMTPHQQQMMMMQQIQHQQWQQQMQRQQQQQQQQGQPPMMGGAMMFPASSAGGQHNQRPPPQQPPQPQQFRPQQQQFHPQQQQQQQAAPQQQQQHMMRPGQSMGGQQQFAPLPHQQQQQQMMGGGMPPAAGQSMGQQQPAQQQQQSAQQQTTLDAKKHIRQSLMMRKQNQQAQQQQQQQHSMNMGMPPQ